MYDLNMTQFPDSPESADSTEAAISFNGSVRNLTEGDLASLRPILEDAVRDSDTKELLAREVEDFLGHMLASSRGEGSRRYVVAETLGGQVAGVMGLVPPSEELRAYAETERPIEVVNAYVAETQGRRGVGRALLGSLEVMARQQGFTELIVNSGPRYEEKGWKFWTKLFGEPVAEIKNAYGEGRDAKVWRKKLAA